MDDPKNKNTPNPSNTGTTNNRDTSGNQSKDRDNAVENIKKSHPTKK